MTRSEFVEGILQALIFTNRMKKMEEEKNKEDEEEKFGNISKKESKSSLTITNQLQINKSNSISNVILNQLEIDLLGYLEINLTEYWNLISCNSLLYSNADANINNNIREIVYHLYQIIKQAYLAYSTILTNNILLGPSINYRELENMLEECSLLDSSNNEYMEYLSNVMRELTTPSIRSAFNHTVTIKRNDIKWYTLNTMCFCEVLECILKLSIVAFDQK